MRRSHEQTGVVVVDKLMSTVIWSPDKSIPLVQHPGNCLLSSIVESRQCAACDSHSVVFSQAVSLMVNVPLQLGWGVDEMYIVGARKRALPNPLPER